MYDILFLINPSSSKSKRGVIMKDFDKRSFDLEVSPGKYIIAAETSVETDNGNRLYVFSIYVSGKPFIFKTSKYSIYDEGKGLTDPSFDEYSDLKDARESIYGDIFEDQYFFLMHKLLMHQYAEDLATPSVVN